MVPNHNLRKSPEYYQLAELIKNASHQSELVLFESPGNWGDALINEGTRQFLHFYNIPYSAHSRSELSNGKTVEELVLRRKLSKSLVLIGGGGGWCSNFSTTKDFTADVAKIACEVIVLPTTFELDVITSPRDNVTYIARDQLGSKKNNPDSLFCHDMAFFILLPGLEKESQAWRIRAMRTDRERSPIAYEYANSVDISMLGNSYHTTTPFFQILSRFETIETDRLHVAIAGSILSKKVTLYGGNYFKSHDVWQSSLKDNYPDTSFAEWGKS